MKNRFKEGDCVYIKPQTTIYTDKLITDKFAPWGCIAIVVKFDEHAIDDYAIHIVASHPVGVGWVLSKNIVAI